MPLYLDVHHKIEGLTKEAIQEAHRRDVEVQEKRGVKYLRYWYDTVNGRVYRRTSSRSSFCPTSTSARSASHT